MTTPKATILIVEDEAKNAPSPWELDPGDEAFQTLSAEDAETGLKMLQSGAVDLA